MLMHLSLVGKSQAFPMSMWCPRRQTVLQQLYGNMEFKFVKESVFFFHDYAYIAVPLYAGYSNFAHVICIAIETKRLNYVLFA